MERLRMARRRNGDPRTRRVQRCVVMLAANLAFWAALLAAWAFGAVGSERAWFVGLILAIEVGAYLMALVGVWFGSRLVALATLALTGGNALLSVTDQVGLLDVISLVLSVAAFVVTIMARNDLMVGRTVGTAP